MQPLRRLIGIWILLGAAAPAGANPHLALAPLNDCYPPSATVTVNLVLSSGPAAIVGGQFFLSFDSSRLTLVSAQPAPVVWTSQIFSSVDPGAGTIDYVVGIPNGANGAHAGTMAVFTFTAVSEVCGAGALVAFRAHSPATTVIDEFNVFYIAGTSLGTSNLSRTSIDGTSPAPLTGPGAGDATLSCDDSAGLAAALAFVPQYADSCAGSVDALLLSDDSVPGDDQPISYIRLRTWTALDDCDNAGPAYSQTITVLATCDDGDACTADDRCVDSQCQGTPLVCDDEFPCTVDTCSGGSCSHDPMPGGTGDSNGDGLTNGRDIPAFIQDVLNAMPTTPHYCAGDMNASGTVDLADVPAFVAALLTG